MKPGRLIRRTPLRRTALLRKTPMKKGPRSVTAKAKDDAWEWFSKFVRLRGSFDVQAEDGTTYRANRCVTCGGVRPITGKGCIQAGHFRPGRHNATLFDPRACWPQCTTCNLFQQGKPDEYERFMVAKFGAAVVEEIKAHARTNVNMTAADYMAVAKQYEVEVFKLWGWPKKPKRLATPNKQAYDSKK